MVSTNEKTIHGNNRGLGWRTRQVGSHISDESLQQIARSLASIVTPSSGPRDSSPLGDAQVVPHVDVDNLGNLYADQGKNAETEKMYRRALDGKEKTWGPEYTSTLNTLNNY